MDSRGRILRALDAHAPVDPAPAPDLAGPWTRPADRRAAFIAAVQSAAGEVVEVADPAALPAAVADLVRTRSARRVASAGAGLPGAMDPEPPRDAHELDGVDLAVLEGEFGVAENGAVWVDAARLPNRALLFLPEHLGVVLRAGSLVDHMGDAYARLRFGARGFGTFLAGPSKTADIEQALVIGAHGPRSLTVLLVGR